MPGGLGFIGHNVVSILEAMGHNPIIMDSRTGYNYLPPAHLEYLMHSRTNKIKAVNLHTFDILPKGDINWVDWIMKNHEIDTVIHLASYPRQKIVETNPIHASRVMIEGLVNLLESSNRNRIKKFIYISSSMVYGDFKNDVKEDAICNPQGQYGILKLAGEQLVKDYSKKSTFTYTIIRPSAVYGPLDGEDRVVSKFILTAMQNKQLKVKGANEILDFTYVDDVAEGIVAATLSDNTKNKIYNITKSQGHTLLDAANLVIKIVGKGTVDITEKDSAFPSRGSLNIDAAKRDFSFNPKIDIEEGFEKYYKWLQNSPFWTSKAIR